jgi:hypothetical protein
MIPHAKAAKVSLDGLCRCVALRLRRGLLRRAVLERSPSLLATGRKALTRPLPRLPLEQSGA